MSILPNAFDSNQHEDMSDFTPIPADKYTAQIVSSSVETTKDKKGKYVKLEFAILSGEYKGRKIWTNLNIINANPQAVEIANKELATICRAVGKVRVQDTQELHGIPLMLGVGIKPAKGDYAAGNKTTNYAPIGATEKPGGKKTVAAAKRKASKPVESGDKSGPWANQ